MKKEYLKRIKFVSENKMVVDGEHKVTKNAGPKKGFIFNGKDGSKLKFQTEEELFEFLDEMTDSSSAGGMELPFVPLSKREFKNRKAAPYNQVVTGLYTESEAVALAEKMVKEALVSEASGDYPAKEMIEKYKAANKKESEKAIKDIEEGIKIVYEKPLAAFPINYYRDDNDYNKDGVPNQYKNNNTLLDLKYDGITDEAKKWFTSQIKAGGKTAEDMAKAAKRKAEIQDKNPLNNAVYVGNDMELSKVNTEKSKDGMPRTGVAMLGFSLNENKMYKFKFESDKYDFGRNRSQLAEAIPNKVKQDNTKFQMQDGKGNLFMLEWANGEAVILEHRNLIAEQKLNEKVDKLFNYNNTEKRPKQKKVDFDYFTKEKIDEDIVTRGIMQNRKQDSRSKALTNQAMERLKNRYFSFFNDKNLILKTPRISSPQNHVLQSIDLDTIGLKHFFKHFYNSESDKKSLGNLEITLWFKNQDNGDSVGIRYKPFNDEIYSIYGRDVDSIKDIEFDAVGVGKMLKFIFGCRALLIEIFEGSEVVNTEILNSPSQITKSDFSRFAETKTKPEENKTKKGFFNRFFNEELDEDIVTKSIMQNKKDDLRSQRLTTSAFYRLKAKYFREFEEKTIEIWNKNGGSRVYYIKQINLPDFNIFKKYLENATTFDGRTQITYRQVNDLTFSFDLGTESESGRGIVITYNPKLDKLMLRNDIDDFPTIELKTSQSYFFDAKGVNIILKIIAAYRLMLKEVFENTELEQTFSEPSQITKSYFPRS